MNHYTEYFKKIEASLRLAPQYISVLIGFGFSLGIAYEFSYFRTLGLSASQFLSVQDVIVTSALSILPLILIAIIYFSIFRRFIILYFQDKSTFAIIIRKYFSYFMLALFLLFLLFIILFGYNNIYLQFGFISSFFCYSVFNYSSYSRDREFIGLVNFLVNALIFLFLISFTFGHKNAFNSLKYFDEREFNIKLDTALKDLRFIRKLSSGWLVVDREEVLYFYESEFSTLSIVGVPRPFEGIVCQSDNFEFGKLLMQICAKH